MTKIEETPPTRWQIYVDRLLIGTTPSEAAHRAGFDKSAFSRWKQGARADPAFVVKLARAFNVNVVQALAEAELITDEEAGTREVRVGAEDIPSKQLAEELAKRITNGTVLDK